MIPFHFLFFRCLPAIWSGDRCPHTISRGGRKGCCKKNDQPPTVRRSLRGRLAARGGTEPWERDAANMIKPATSNVSASGMVANGHQAVHPMEFNLRQACENDRVGRLEVLISHKGII